MKHIINARDYYSLGIEIMKQDEELMGAIDYEHAEDIGYSYHEEHNGWFENGNYVWYDVCDCLEINPYMIKPALEVFTPEEIEEYGEYHLIEEAYNDYELGQFIVFNWMDSVDRGLLKYIDYEKLGRDFRLETEGDFTSKGYIYVD